jgi:predicted ATP-grasp superfamily ATP-dependent carboligase
MKILITGVGGPTPRSFAIALKKYSFHKRFEIVGTDINPLAIGLYQNELFNKTYVVPSASSPDYWQTMEKIITDNQIDIAIILPELEVMEWSRRKINSALPCKALIPDYSLAELLVDKSKMTEILKDLDIVPPSVTFSRDTQKLDEVFNVLKGNFWVRSTSGTSGLGSLKVEDEDSLKNWIQINPNVQQFIASKFLSGRNLACKMLYYNGKLLRTACAERVNYIMAKVAPSGITGNTSFGRLLNEPELVNEAKRAMDHLFGYTGAAQHGFFTVDFKEDENGKPYITEINVRHVAFTQCFAAGGANFAADTVRLLHDDPQFDLDYKMYEFEKDLIFLRDVDSIPILMKESELLQKLL